MLRVSVIVRCAVLAWVGLRVGAGFGQELRSLETRSLEIGSLDMRYLGQQGWSTEEGLPQSSVHSLAQTKDGYIWAATEGGLARFDGVGFAVFGRGNEAAFQSDDLCCLLADAGGLWVGSSDGLLRMEGGRFKRYGVAEGLASGFVLSLREGDGGQLLVETTGGWSQWDRAKFVATNGVENGWRVLGGELSVRGVKRTWRVGRELPAGRVMAVLVDREGMVWVGMSTGLVVADPVSGVVKGVDSVKGSSVLSLFEDAEGDHWVGTETTGLHVVRRLEFRGEAGLAGVAVTAVAQTSDGAMWVGSRDDGLRRLRGGRWEPMVRGLTSLVVLCLAADGRGGLWVGTPDGLNLVTAGGVVRQITAADGLPDETVRSVAGVGDGSVWVGTRRGLVHVRVDGGRVAMKTLTRADGLGGELIGTMRMDAKGVLWVATSEGVGRVSGEGRVESYGVQGGIVKGIAEGRDGGVWLAAEDGSLSRFDGRGFVRAMRVGGGEEKVVAMEADRKGSLWVRMERGVRRVSVAAARACAGRAVCDAAVAVYGVADGMPTSEAVAEGASEPWLTASGEMWFPTRGGVAVADTLRTADGAAPPVAIERLLVDDVAQTMGGEAIELRAGRSRLTVEYAGLSFVAPSEVRYRFMLEGFDEGWMDAGWTDAGMLRVATYTNLPPGRYTFRVIAKNGDGVWSRDAATLRLRVVPPFYRRWWFVLLCVMVLGAVLVGLYLLRLRRVRQGYEAVLAERNRMAREIHDTLTQEFVGTSLQLDLLYQHLKSGKVGLALEDVRRTRMLVSDGLEEARRSMRELRAGRSGAAGEGLGVRLAAVVAWDRFAGIEPRLTVSGVPRVLEARVESEVVRIVQEALANALQHAQATESWLELAYGEDELVLTVRDNGGGFSMEEAMRKEGHFGLIGMRERAAAIGGTLEVVSEVGKGTMVRVRVAMESSG